MSRIATIEIHPAEITFSSGHFTIFSSTERENMHGHNYSVGAVLQINLEKNGISFDYRYYKKKLFDLVQPLKWRFLLPAHSPFLKIEETDDYYFAHFNKEKIPFLKRDVVILPLSNITLEELSYWLLQHIIQEPEQLKAHCIQSVTLKVYNGPGQSGSASWACSI